MSFSASAHVSCAQRYIHYPHYSFVVVGKLFFARNTGYIFIIWLFLTQRKLQITHAVLDNIFGIIKIFRRFCLHQASSQLPFRFFSFSIFGFRIYSLPFLDLFRPKFYFFLATFFWLLAEPSHDLTSASKQRFPAITQAPTALRPLFLTFSFFFYGRRTISYGLTCYRPLEVLGLGSSAGLAR